MTLVTEIRQVVRRLMRSPMFTLVTLPHHCHRCGCELRGVQCGDAASCSACCRIRAGRIDRRLANSAPPQHQRSERFAVGLHLRFEENRTFQSFGLWNGGSVAVTGASGSGTGAVPGGDGRHAQRVGSGSAAGPVVLRRRTTSLRLRRRRFSRTVTGSASSAAIPRPWAASFVVDGKLTSITGVMPQSFRFFG